MFFYTSKCPTFKMSWLPGMHWDQNISAAAKVPAARKIWKNDDIICRMFQLSSTFYTLKVWRRHAPNIKETHTQPLASRDGAGTLWNLSGEGVADPLSKCAKVRKKRGCPPKKFIKYCTGENDCSLLTKRTLGKTCWNETKKCKMFRHQKWVVVVQRSAKSLKVSRGHDSISDRMNNATSYENHVPGVNS